MTVNTWASLGTLLGVFVALASLIITQTRSTKRELGDRIDALRTELTAADARLEAKIDAKIDALHTELTAADARLEASVTDARHEARAASLRLDDRIYTLTLALRPDVAAAVYPVHGAARDATDTP